MNKNTSTDVLNQTKSHMSTIKLPKFIKTEVEKRLFNDILTIEIEPKRKYNVSSTLQTFAIEYFKTADIYYATKMAHPHKNTSYEIPPEKNIESIINTSSGYYALIHYIYEVIKKLKRNGYLKLGGVIIDQQSIHKDWLKWFLKDDQLFTYPPINASINFYKETVTQFQDNHSPHHARVTGGTLKVDKDNNKLDTPEKIDLRSTTRAADYPIKELSPSELINNSILRNPEILALHESFAHLDTKEVQKKIMAIHATNLHFIALDDEERTSDRIKASEIMLKIAGAFELDNKQKGEALKAAFTNDDVHTIVEGIKNKQEQIRQYFGTFEDAKVIDPSYADNPNDIASLDTEEGIKSYIDHNGLTTND
jgi:hypothetical protein